MITHITKSGKVKSIKGRKVTRKDVPQFYALAERVKRKTR